jgi:hypothetical protein
MIRNGEGILLLHLKLQLVEQILLHIYDPSAFFAYEVMVVMGDTGMTAGLIAGHTVPNLQAVDHPQLQQQMKCPVNGRFAHIGINFTHMPKYLIRSQMGIPVLPQKIRNSLTLLRVPVATLMKLLLQINRAQIASHNTLLQSDLPLAHLHTLLNFNFNYNKSFCQRYDVFMHFFQTNCPLPTKKEAGKWASFFAGDECCPEAVNQYFFARKKPLCYKGF